MSEALLGSGHKWDCGGELCLLCGEKDWYAEGYCSANPEVSDQRLKWIEHNKDAISAIKNSDSNQEQG